MDYYERLTPIFQDVLGNDDLEVTPELHAGMVEEWDSLGHIKLIVGVEKEFDIRIDVSEISRLKNVGDLVALLERKVQP